MTYAYFSEKELACSCGCGRGIYDMDPDYMEVMEAIRSKVGFPLPVTSGFRCPDYNAKISKTGEHGPHTTGRALDIRVDRIRAYQVIQAAIEFGITGIGIAQKGDGRFLHLDMVERKGDLEYTIWSY